MEKAIHYTSPYIINPTHAITVTVVGCGGIGSQMLTNLAKANQALLALGHPGLKVSAYDPDKVSPSNRGRQLFSASDIGQNKAILLISRINRFFGTDWRAYPVEYSKRLFETSNPPHANILITCVDSAKARKDISRIAKPKYLQEYETPYYWMDMGNSRYSGQVILGTLSSIVQPKSKYKVRGDLQTVTEMYPDLEKFDNEKEQGPSCSMAEALTRQDLFISSTVANWGSILLWKLLREGRITSQGVFVNLETMQTNPMHIQANDQKPKASSKKLVKKLLANS